LPTVTSVTLPNTLIPLGEPGRAISGRSSDDASAIGVRFAGLGSGYWLVPTRSADVVNGGELEWRVEAAFGRGIPPGLHRLLFAALDTRGQSGTQAELNVCVAPEVPDNGNSCNPTTSPPALVVSLSWTAAVDLDLRVVTPSGKVVDSKHPSTVEADEDGKFDPSLPGTGVITHDSFAHCLAEGTRRENLVFQTSPASGTYLVYANLYDACQEASVEFDVSLHTAVPGAEPDTFSVQQTYHQAGQLQAVHANGGAKLGLFVTSFNAH
jgi:YD repeat-containing protein